MESYSMQRTLARGIDQGYKLKSKLAKQEAAAKELEAKLKAPPKADTVDQASNTLITGSIVNGGESAHTIGRPRAFQIRPFALGGLSEESQ